VVTGANGGIGGAIAGRLSHEGIRVVATDVGPEPAPSIAAIADYVQLDLLSADIGFEGLFAAVGGDGLDYLVNAAGLAMMDQDGSIVDINDDDVWDRTLGVNLHGVRKLTAAAVPHLRKGSGKSIVNVASVAGLRGMDSPLDAYQVSKAAVVSLSRAVALRLASERIRYDMECRTPLGRLGTPEDIANAASFLLSEQASFITAAEFVVDGGWMAQLK
jgi:NAD(P)-dependent dehydrogenase (short-subunit alcohol dehydrogenase family)